MRKFRIKGLEEIFDNQVDAYNYVLEFGEAEGLSIEDVEPVPDYDFEAYCQSHPEDPRCKEHRKKIHGEIENSPEETPSDVEVISETTLVQTLAGKKALESYDGFEKTAQSEIIQQGLNISQRHREGEPKLKSLAEHSTTESYIQDQYQRLVEILADNETTTVCPICGRPFEEGLTGEELSFFEPSTKPIRGNPDDWEKQARKRTPKLPKVLENQFPRIRLIHIATKHPAIFQLLKDLYKVPKSERRYDDDEKPDQQGHLSKKSESLSEEEKEELTEELVKTKEGREAVYKAWLREIEERN